MARTEKANSWRREMPPEDRLKVCKHVTVKLEQFYQENAVTITSEELNERARVFESKVYTRATSRQDYLRQIAEGLTGIDSAAQASRHTPPPPPDAQISQPNEPQLQALTGPVFNADGHASSPGGAVRVGPGSAGLSSSNPGPGQN